MLTGALLALMLLLAMLQSGSCEPSDCIDVPPWVLYALHAAAIACCLWAIVDALRELLEARRASKRAATTDV